MIQILIWSWCKNGMKLQGNNKEKEEKLRKKDITHFHSRERKWVYANERKLQISVFKNCFSALRFSLL